ncbi:MAG: 23S rRNA (pseudouridine(1915)-N(3))-methyltransferase RlmH [Alphaproteobacteria bacterium]|jgi:23S rRNA (pseudouridine1915-N3)-methyltransferase|nr:23S rRNA (pseudouridine(1915)-N(3))-methyltransferase RlmH [Alphaproteobacteria bacterium]MBT6474680.1 23S rRNA (pseudouridine(1915)-N(3))-methyltransferase RlmH [Rhodospirillaceae bacterium]MBT4017117.1 23S rRNA (pseudouridine(1915)-N(3))-methyltransferase RlmH [Alphaproteobacteria bacterium]MBT4966415.1 23S rRNA (pseudouridine(1915)-N(3))-methyltransferase RlmH [Alphaproteobacteria bacterium]MBT5160910.1 23S rRNA (pseudouridine(1915)-N(3))-methyltransferase RlmH [Alphaproteobacteria bacter
MQFGLVAIGRARKGAMRELFEDYATRLNPKITLKEVEERRPLKGDELKRREAQLLLEAIPDDAYVIAMDGRGKQLSSEALAVKIQSLQDDGQRSALFVIGGADGHDQSLLDRANFTLSLGPQTWPHMLVRVMLAEQIYRADSILRGHPYHRA